MSALTASLRKRLTLRRGVLIAGHLVGVGLLIGALVEPSTVDAVLHESPGKLLTSPVPSLPSHNVPPLDLIQSRALFHESRVFYVPPLAPVVPVELKPPPPAYKVATVLMSAHHTAVALLTDAQGKGVLKVHQGDVVAGWTVESVEPKRVTLVFQQDRIELGPKLLTAVQNSTGNTGGSAATAGAPLSTVNSPGSTLSSGSLLSAGPQGGIRVLQGNAGAVATGRPSVTPRVFQLPPH